MKKLNINATARTNHMSMVTLFIIAFASLMSACTRIESGQVGVQRDFSGE